MLRARGLSTMRLTARASTAPAVDFNNAQLAFASRSTYDLLRGAAVLAVCSQPMIVRHADTLLGLATKIIGKRATQKLVRETFYAHFVAGESALAIAPKMAALQKHGVGGILDYAAEANLSVSDISDITDVPNQPARVYPYKGESNCDANAAAFHAAVRAVADTTPDGFAAIKVSALGDPALLERVSDGLVAMRNLFRTLDSDGTGKISAEVFTRKWPELFNGISIDEASEMFNRIDADADGFIDAIDWLESIPLADVPQLVKKCRNRGALFRSALSPAEVDATDRMLERLDAIAGRAEHLGVRLMVDAEHTYLQPAIDHAVLHLQRKYNREYPAVYATYQAYLHDCVPRLKLDLERAKREGWHFGAKLVRGAYMVHERDRALKLGYPSPIQPTAEDTHQAYADCTRLLLVDCPVPSRTSAMFATHNKQSVREVIRILVDGESRVPKDNIGFGQLLGMADHLTFALGSEGFRSYKYVPYGPLDEVMPYLMRRAQENCDALSGASVERVMMLCEARRRVLGF